MNSRGLHVMVAWGVLLSLWITSSGWGVGVPPILNAKITDQSGTYYEGIYEEGYDDCENNAHWVDVWDYYEGGCGPSNMCPDCSSYVAFGTWYYQNCLLEDSGTTYSDFDMDTAPLYLDHASSSYAADGFGHPPTPIDIQAKLFPIQGLDALRYIPVEVQKTVCQPTTSARYGIRITADYGAQPPNTTVGALFWITAIYDSSVFDVYVNGWEYEYCDPSAFEDGNQRRLSAAAQSQASLVATSGNRPQFSTGIDTDLWAKLDMVWLNSPFVWYNQDMILPSGMPMLFTDDARCECFTTYDLRRRSLPLTPDYIVVRLKDGHRLEDLGGHKVELILHTLSWIGDSYWCSPTGDAFRYSRTSQVLVGADLDETTNDWRTQPAELKDECLPPSFSKTQDKSAEADVIGTRVVKDLNVDLPSMRVGLNRCKVSRTLAATLANDSVFYPFGLYLGDDNFTWPLYSASFTVTNVNGVWCAAEDLPGWTVGWVPDVSGQVIAHGIWDNDSQLAYMYLTTGSNSDGSVSPWDYVYWPAKLVEIDNLSDLTQIYRMYRYDGGDATQPYGDITQPVIEQVDSSGNYIEYGYTPVANGSGLNDLKVTFRGNGERTASATFAAWPTIPNDPGSCPLLTCTNGSSNSCRQYEWYPPSDPPKPYDGKLKAVKDANNDVLAGFEYDNRGRLVKRTRGSSAQTVAEYVYNETPAQPRQPLGNYTMDARFYVDDGAGGKYQLVRRTFNPQGQVTRIEEFQELQEDGSESGTKSVTTFDYCDPPATGLNSSNSYLYYYVYWNGCDWAALGRCQIKTLPVNQSGQSIAEYAQYDPDAGWNVLQTFLAPPPGTDTDGQKTEPTPDDRYNWMVYGPYNGTSPPYLNTRQIDKNRSTNTPYLDNAVTNFTYDNQGYRQWQDDATVTGLDGHPTQKTQFWTYTPLDPAHPSIVDHRKVSSHWRSGPNGRMLVTGYAYDPMGNMIQKAEGWSPNSWTNPTFGPTCPTWNYDYNAFGQQILETDPDLYCHQTDYDSDTGLITGTCVFDPYDAGGSLEQQITYEYQNGMLWKIHVADDNSPFAYGSPAAWIDTTYTYDNYGRLSSKLVSGFTTSYEYDRQDRLVKVTWHDGRWKQITRDGRGQITQIQYGKGSTTLASTYTYDDVGNLVTRTTEGCPQCGKRTEYGYDRYNRRISETRKGS